MITQTIFGVQFSLSLLVPDNPGFGRSKAPPGYGFSAQELAETMVTFSGRLWMSPV